MGYVTLPEKDPHLQVQRLGKQHPAQQQRTSPNQSDEQYSKVVVVPGVMH